MASKTADQSFVREINISTVLRIIHTESPISRSQIASASGLNKSTVSSIVNELLTKNLIHETGSTSEGTGRPSTLLEINPMAGLIIGAELGVDFISVAVTDFLGNIIWRKREDTDPLENQETTLNQTLHIVREGMAYCEKINVGYFGIGVAIPGTVDIDEGVMIFAPNLQWRNVPIRQIFSENTGLQTYVENDANAASIAEHLFGTARESGDFIFVFAGVGIGGGLFLNGELYRGRNGFAGEIGHSPIMGESSETVCHCGNRGCWEIYANQQSIIQRVQEKHEAKSAGILSDLMNEKKSVLTISIIKEAAEAGEANAIEAIQEAGQAMGQGFAGLINIFNPEKIILGGPLSIVGDYLLPSIKETIKRHAWFEITQMTDVLLSTFGADASLFGAVAIVINDVLSKPMQFERR